LAIWLFVNFKSLSKIFYHYKIAVALSALFSQGGNIIFTKIWDF